MANSTLLSKPFPYKISELFNQYCGTVERRNPIIDLSYTKYLLNITAK